MAGTDVPGLHLRPYDSSRDTDPAYQLWLQALGPAWPITPTAFAQRAREGVVAVADGRMVGFALTAPGPGEPSLTAMAVAPDRQGKGIGTALHAAVRSRLAADGARSMRMGGASFWCGVPHNLPAASPFFAARGWRLDQPFWDMAMNLRDFVLSPEVYERARAQGIGFRRATAKDLPALMALQEAHFPQWSHFYPAAPAESILVAVDRESRIVGSVLLDLPSAQECVWGLLLGQNTAEIGAVSIDPSLEGRGLGTALMSFACEELRAAGIETALVRWLVRLGFYNRVGFRVWQGFSSGSLEL